MMRFLRKILFVIIITLINFANPNSLIAQDSYSFSRTFTKLHIVNTDFELILDSLLERELKCEEYNKSLYWSVSFTELKSNEFVISITMQREISDTYKYLGYFKIKGVLFILSGNQIHTDFFIKCDNEQEFKFQNMKMPQVEDYSTWLYGYKEKTLFLRESYPLPCNKN